MSADWVATPQAPFSLEFGRTCCREMVQKLVRCRMNEAARKREIREFAEVVLQVMRKEKGN